MKENIIQREIPFSKLGNYHIGGPVEYFAEPASEEELREVLRYTRERNLPLLIIGEGTNILMKDEGFRGMVIKPGIHFIKQKGNKIEVGSGVLVSELLEYAIMHNLSGFEWAGGLPGSVGGGVRGNAGCFGGEMKDNIEKVESINVETGEKRTWARPECEFEYRSSIFKTKFDNQEIITRITFTCVPVEDNKKIKEIADSHIQYRKEKQPLEYPNIGSIFKNVDARNFSEDELLAFEKVMKTDPFPVIPTAYLISEAGLKGRTHGDAMISPKHPNFIVNCGMAKAADIHFLIEEVKKEVRKKFGLEIETEIIRT